jgi:proteasome lid subunit RPN8/RPN11
MQLTFPYRFALSLFRHDDGTSLGRVPVGGDWERFELAARWARLQLQRRGELPAEGEAGATVVPRWDRQSGEPWCRGYGVEFARRGGPSVVCEFPNTHFRELAEAAASLFVERQMLRAGDRYAYLVAAHAAQPEPSDSGRLEAVDASPGLPLCAGSLREFLARARPYGTAADEEAKDLPVFVPARVLRAVAAQTRAHDGIETGGILIGALRHDTAAPEIFAEITAAIPAEHTVGTNARLTFTPRTWAAADAALRLRHAGEIYCGWYHSHPVKDWCKKECSPEARRSCSLTEIFSVDDQIVMRLFPRADSVALVANDTAGGLTFSMFANREGLFQKRNFHVLDEEEENSATQAGGYS